MSLRSTVIRMALLIGVMVVCFAGGVLVEKHRKGWLAARVFATADDRLSGPRQEVPFSALQGKRVMVALVLGQSNAANFGEGRRVAGPGVFNFFEGKIYRAEDPMLGADNRKGSVWTRLGDAIVARGLYDAVVFAPVAVGNTAIAQWTTTGALHGQILETIAHVHASGLRLTHVLWHQGETDARMKTPGDTYRRMFLDLLESIRLRGVDAPVYVSVATRCQALEGNPEIRQAQRRLVDPARGVLAGPDTDTLGLCYRYDGCHFTNEGLQRFAELWLAVLARAQ